MGVIQVPDGAGKIIEKLNQNGFEAYVVGGCVRDSLLGREPEDWDITTSAKPSEVKEIFGRTIDTGIAHGTVTVMVNHTGYEVTTYRVDGEYLDGRHPRSVEFTASLPEDLKRRDFTINAMAYSERAGLVDEFEGEEDLRRGIIRCVGDAKSRFTEDALRILRAIRFSAQLGFSIEEKTLEAIRDIAPNMAKVSKERIATELGKLLISGHPEQIALVYDMGIAPYVADGFLKVKWDRNPGILKRLGLLPPQKAIRWAGFLRFETPEDAGKVLRCLKLDNATIDAVKTLTGIWQDEIPPEKAAIRRIMSRMSPELFDDLLILRDVFGDAGEAERERREKVKALSRGIREDGDCVRLKDLAVTGKDLIAIGMKPGPALGETLERLFQVVLENPEYNTKEYLVNYL